MNRTLVMLLAALPLLSACGTTWSNHVITGKASQAFTGQVKLVMEGAPIPEGLEEVALVQATGNGMKAQMAPVIEQLQMEAAALGCDTIIRVRVDQGASVASANGVCARTSTASRGAE